jgi:MFS family permease
MAYTHAHRATRSFQAVFASTLLWNTQPHLVVFTLLFLQKGISLSQFFIMQSIGSITAFLLEVPTGILADRLGRKFSLVASLTLGLILTPIFILSKSLWVLYAASVLGGISSALRSGADEALFYDSLKESGREAEYTRLNGSLRWWSGNTGIAASILGRRGKTSLTRVFAR